MLTFHFRSSKMVLTVTKGELLIAKNEIYRQNNIFHVAFHGDKLYTLPFQAVHLERGIFARARLHSGHNRSPRRHHSLPKMRVRKASQKAFCRHEGRVVLRSLLLRGFIPLFVRIYRVQQRK